MRIVVTGGAGFIGIHVVAALVDAGHDVVVLDSLDPSAHDGVPVGLPHGADYRWVDLRDADAVRAAVDGADAVDHHAARVGLGVDFGDVRHYVAANDLGTAVLLWALHTTGFAGRLVLASSMVVYGEGRYECHEHGAVRPAVRHPADLDAGRFEPGCPQCQRPLVPLLVDEDAPTDPRNVYAATKLHQEHLCAAFGREHDVPVTALRYHNVYGTGMPRDTPYAGVTSVFRSQLAAGRRPTVMEDGAQRRDFVEVADVARANVLALTAPVPYDGPLNIASGQPCTVLEMACAIAAAHDGGLEPEVVGGYRLGDVRHVTADPGRAVDALGFRAAVAPDVGFAAFATAPLRAGRSSRNVAEKVRRPMGFVQIIELNTTKADELIALDRAWEKATEGKRTLTRAVVGRDRNNPSRHVILAFFDSYESAMENSNLPETKSFAERQSALLDAPPVFTDLDIIDERL